MPGMQGGRQTPLTHRHPRGGGGPGTSGQISPTVPTASNASDSRRGSTASAISSNVSSIVSSSSAASPLDTKRMLQTISLPSSSSACDCGAMR